MYFDDATIQIYSKKDRKDRKNVSIYDREYVTTEQVATPAGTFDCTKVKYKIKSRSPKETIEGYGYEWYAPNVGVVKNEQYNNNNQLQYYTCLTGLSGCVVTEKLQRIFFSLNRQKK